MIAKAYDDKDENKSREMVFEAVGDLFHRFSMRRGASLCKEILGADISTEEGIKRIKEEQLVNRICCSKGGIGQDVAEILEDLLWKK